MLKAFEAKDIENKIKEKNELEIIDTKLTKEDVDMLLDLLADNSIHSVHIENIKISILDWIDLLKFLIEYQKELQRLSLISVPFEKNRKLLKLTMDYVFHLENLNYLSLSNNRLHSIDYGLILNTLKKIERSVQLDLSGCKFTTTDEVNFTHFLEKHPHVKKIIFDAKSFSEDGQQSMAHLMRRNSNFTIEQSQIASYISHATKRKGLTTTKNKQVTVVGFSTEEKENKLPKLYIKCVCGRDMATHDMFNCNKCCKSLCKYCTDNNIYCYTCFSCSKSNIPSMLSITATTNNRCASCLQCPVCLNILTNYKYISPEKRESYFFYCKFCYWNSKTCGMACDTSSDLVRGNFDKTKIIGKNLENTLNDAYEIQKNIIMQKNRYPLVKFLEKEFAKRNELKTNIKVEEVKNNTSHHGYKMAFEIIPKRYPVFKNRVIDEKNYHFLFGNLYTPEPEELSRLSIIENYKKNHYNLKLFENFPLILYRSKNDFLIPQNKLNVYILKNCEACMKSLVSYELQSDTVNVKTSSFYNDFNPNYQIKNITKLDEVGEEKYKAEVNLYNPTTFKFKLKLRCKDNCEFVDGREEIEHEFKSNMDLAGSIIKMSSNIETEEVLKFNITFVVNYGEENVYFSFMQTKILELQNETIINDEFIVKFSDYFSFEEYMASGNTNSLYV